MSITLEAPKRISYLQKVEITSFMEANVEAMNNIGMGSEGRKAYSAMWTSLIDHLNSIPGAVKTIKEWQRAWSDMKMAAKKKKLLKPMHLDAVDERILTLMKYEVVPLDLPETGVGPVFEAATSSLQPEETEFDEILFEEKPSTHQLDNPEEYKVINIETPRRKYESPLPKSLRRSRSGSRRRFTPRSRSRRAPGSNDAELFSAVNSAMERMAAASERRNELLESLVQQVTSLNSRMHDFFGTMEQEGMVNPET